MKIAFQTLACPSWHWETIVAESQRMGYDGIEIRGIEGEMYLPKARPFLPERIEATKADLKARGLEICCLDSSCAFHDRERYENAIAEGRDTIDLAVKLGVPHIRVFGDLVPPGAQAADVAAMVAQGLEELGRYAEGKGVEVLLETHGDFNNHGIIRSVLDHVRSDAVGILWDFEHPFMHGEAAAETYRHLAPYIKHTHVKDARHTDGGKELCLIGDGEVPVPGIVALLQEGGYAGWLSLEYEKQWVPALEEPEVSLPAFIGYIRQVLGQ